MPGPLVGLAAHLVGVLLRGTPQPQPRLLRLGDHPPGLVAPALADGRGLLDTECEQLAGALAERLVRLRGQPGDRLTQPVEFPAHLPGQHGQPGGPLPCGVPVPREGPRVGVDLVGSVATPYDVELELMGCRRCAAHAGPSPPDTHEMMISRTS